MNLKKKFVTIVVEAKKKKHVQNDNQKFVKTIRLGNKLTCQCCWTNLGQTTFASNNNVVFHTKLNVTRNQITTTKN